MSRISLLISDVDGTLVTKDKVLTARSRQAVSQLAAGGIAFSIVSARPPFGLRMLVEPLSLTLPMGVFNGAGLVRPDLTAIDQRFLPHEAAADALALLRRFAVDIWVFTDDRWLVESADSSYIAREERAVLASPTIVERLDDDLFTVGKMVGVSDDSERLSACEAAARDSLGGAVSIVRSQLYYLDFTPPGTDKGLTVDALSARLGIPPNEIATIGDMDNDVPMFRKSGFSIAMGNATDQVKEAANAVTASNEEEGFALAVENLILSAASG